jgi:ABC-type Mn2+/Zn2+ transport system permease subunit
MIQKSRPRLLFAGLAMCSPIALAFFYKLLWGPTIVLFLIGLYLIVWATLGKAQWCRNCKMFNL